MDNSIFRKKSIDKMQSPDNLKEYIKVINPSLWIVFIAVLLLLAGAFVWGYFGTIEDKMPVTAIVQNGSAICEYKENVTEGMKVSVGENEGTVSSVNSSGIKIEFENELPDGVYSAYIILGTISPISFVFN